MTKIVKLKNFGSVKTEVLLQKMTALRYVVTEKWLFLKKDFEMMAMTFQMMDVPIALLTQGGIVLLEV